jgi:hypothetical protein
MVSLSVRDYYDSRIIYALFSTTWISARRPVSNPEDEYECRCIQEKSEPQQDSARQKGQVVGIHLPSGVCANRESDGNLQRFPDTKLQCSNRYYAKRRFCFFNPLGLRVLTFHVRDSGGMFRGSGGGKTGSLLLNYLFLNRDKVRRGAERY